MMKSLADHAVLLSLEENVLIHKLTAVRFLEEKDQWLQMLLSSFCSPLCLYYPKKIQTPEVLKPTKNLDKPCISPCFCHCKDLVLKFCKVLQDISRAEPYMKQQ